MENDGSGFHRKFELSLVHVGVASQFALDLGQSVAVALFVSDQTLLLVVR